MGKTLQIFEMPKAFVTQLQNAVKANGDVLKEEALDELHHFIEIQEQVNRLSRSIFDKYKKSSLYNHISTGIKNGHVVQPFPQIYDDFFNLTITLFDKLDKAYEERMLFSRSWDLLGEGWQSLSINRNKISELTRGLEEEIKSMKTHQANLLPHLKDIDSLFNLYLEKRNNWAQNVNTYTEQPGEYYIKRMDEEAEKEFNAEKKRMEDKRESGIESANESGTESENESRQEERGMVESFISLEIKYLS